MHCRCRRDSVEERCCGCGSPTEYFLKARLLNAQFRCANSRRPGADWGRHFVPRRPHPEPCRAATPL